MKKLLLTSLLLIIPFLASPQETHAAAKATGGTYTESGGYGIHKFTSSGTFTPSASFNVESLVVAGGGGGGSNGGGGGGAGGLRYSASLAVNPQAYSITVGAGGYGYGNSAQNGGNSIFSTLTAIGGGGGGSRDADQIGSAGGSGGGAGGAFGTYAGGVGSQGRNGGVNYPGGGQAGPGGGGGCGAVGGTGGNYRGGNGGIGCAYSISGSSVYYAGGGGGGLVGGFSGTPGTGGNGGGGNGVTPGGRGYNGTANTGGGGGGNNGTGGSGIVIIRYLITPPTAPTIATATPLSNSSIRWNFTDNANDETGFKVYDTNNVLKVTCASANLSSCTETGLSTLTSYTRKVVAYNSNGNSSYSSTATATTLTTPPTAPTIATATPLSNSSIRWNFTDNASDETGFKVYDTSNVLKATCASANLSSCTETGLSTSTSYTRKVVAYNAGGNSAYSSTTTTSTMAIACAPSLSDSTHIVYSNCSFPNTIVDFADSERYLTGITAGISTDNTAILTISSNTLTILANQTVATGSIILGGGSIAIADGGIIELDKPIWVIDADADYYPANATGYLQTTAPTNGLRFNAMTSLTPDCDENIYSTINSCCTIGTYYADSDGDGYGAGASSQRCPTAGYVTNNTDCYDSNANAKPGSTTCSTAHRGDGSYDYNCSSSQTKCGSTYYSSYYSCPRYSAQNRCLTNFCRNWISSTVACGVSGCTAGVTTNMWASECNDAWSRTACGVTGTQACQ
jgi:hypothetical protein